MDSTRRIFDAVVSRNINEMRVLLDENPQLVNVVDNRNHTPLFVAAMAGDVSVVSELLKPPSGDIVDVEIVDRFGRDAYDAALDLGHSDVILMLRPIFE